MSEELGLWLRQQRETRGLTRPEMARRLIAAGRAKGDYMPGTDSMCHNIYRWERGADGLSERYKLCYCQIFGISPSLFGPGNPEGPVQQTPAAASVPSTPDIPPPVTRSICDPGQTDLPVLLEAAVISLANRSQVTSRHGKRCRNGSG